MDDKWLNHLANIPASQARRQYEKEMRHRRHIWTRHHTTTLLLLMLLIAAIAGTLLFLFP